VHVTLVPHIASAGELKPTAQHSVREMREIGGSGHSSAAAIADCSRPQEKDTPLSNVRVNVVSAVDVSCI
jgi:CTP synthase (UTP-ammonia lyase)